MSFSEIYTWRLQSLPANLRDSAVQYDKLQEVVKSVADELTDNGLSPQLLRDLVSLGQVAGDTHELQDTGVEVVDHTMNNSKLGVTHQSGMPWHPRVAYELKSESGQLVSQLRFWVRAPPRPPQWERGRKDIVPDTDISHIMERRDSEGARRTCKIVSPLLPAVIVINCSFGIGDTDSFCHEQSGTFVPDSDSPKKQVSEFQVATTDEMNEVQFIIPLIRDGEIFTTLARNLEDIYLQLKKLQSVLSESVADLARKVGDTCQPASVAAGFRPYSRISTHPGTIEVKDKALKSDLYAWRDIFRLYVESEIFLHNGEEKRCEWSLDESESRLKSFVDKVAQRWLHMSTYQGPVEEEGNVHVGEYNKFQYKQSMEALETFIGLNMLALDIKKCSYLNAEAIEDLLRTRSERCALPTPFFKTGKSVSPSPMTVPLHAPLQMFSIMESLASEVLKAFVHSIESTLFPVVPSPDDYSCAICMGIAFKPIRLSCMHLFCVRCLVKMQKRREANCPMCRARSVLAANSKNVDWALLNFMQDWFPREAREKLKANEREVAAELYSEWAGSGPSCCIA